ncbi:MAG: exodeoxyribonuclease VII small subunit [bacterium]
MVKEKQSFEKSLQKLEVIVQKLEKGDISLDDSIGLYQEGISLARFCSKKLDEAKAKIEIVVKEKDNFTKEAFDPEKIEKKENNDMFKPKEGLF